MSAIAVYAIAAAFLPGIYIGNVSSVLIAAVGGLTFWKYAPDSYYIVFHGDRSRMEPGAHLAVYGTACLAFGSIWIGCYTLLYYWYDQPETWRGSAWGLSFGRMWIAAGFWLLWLSPSISKQGIKTPSILWSAAALVIALLAAYHIGVRVGEYRAQ